MKKVLVILALGMLSFSTSASACNIGDIGCDPFKLSPAPSIRLEPQLELKPRRELAPRQQETGLQWCSAYYKGQRGQKTDKNNQYCRNVLKRYGY